MSGTEKKTKGEILFKTPLKLKSSQIVFKDPEIELSIFRNNETSNEAKVEIIAQVNLPGTPVTIVRDVISRYKTKEIKKAETEYRDMVQGLADGKKKITVTEENSSFYFQVVNE